MNESRFAIEFKLYENLNLSQCGTERNTHVDHS